MSFRTSLCLAALAGALLAALPPAVALPAPSAPASAAAVAPPTTLNFAGAPYLHRWSKGGEHEYTPPPQSDLAQWRDMVSIQVHDTLTTPDQLAILANTALTAYQKGGLILRTHSLKASPGHPAEHMIVAVLSDKGVREIVYARFRLAPEAGEAIVYSHRVVGMQPDVAATAWLKANDQAVERAMMAWSDLPTVPALRTLPQAP